MSSGSRIEGRSAVVGWVGVGVGGRLGGWEGEVRGEGGGEGGGEGRESVIADELGWRSEDHWKTCI